MMDSDTAKNDPSIKTTAAYWSHPKRRNEYTYLSPQPLPLHRDDHSDLLQDALTFPNLFAGQVHGGVKLQAIRAITVLREERALRALSNALLIMTMTHLSTVCFGGQLVADGGCANVEIRWTPVLFSAGTRASTQWSEDAKRPVINVIGPSTGMQRGLTLEAFDELVAAILHCMVHAWLMIKECRCASCTIRGEEHKQHGMAWARLASGVERVANRVFGGQWNLNVHYSVWRDTVMDKKRLRALITGESATEMEWRGQGFVME